MPKVPRAYGASERVMRRSSMHSVCATYLDRWTTSQMRSRIHLSHTEQGKGVLLAIQHEKSWYPWSIHPGGCSCLACRECNGGARYL